MSREEMSVDAWLLATPLFAGKFVSGKAYQFWMTLIMIPRFKTQLQFPILDSYPQIYPEAAGQPSLPLKTSLFTDQSISKRMKNLKTQVTWGVGVEEREILSNSLAEIAEAYHDDWSSGSDEGDDE